MSLLPGVSGESDIFSGDPSSSFLGKVASLFKSLRRWFLRREEDGIAHRLETERSLYQAVLRHLPAGVLIAEAPSGRLIFGNEGLARILRHPFVPAARFEEYTAYGGRHPDGRPLEPDEWALARAIQRGEEVVGQEIHFPAGDGGTVVVRSNAIPLQDGHGRIFAGVATFFDVTAEWQAEQALQESQARTERLFEANILGIFYADEQARITGANDAFLAMIGHGRGELERGRLSWVELTPPGWEEADQKAMVELMATGACSPYEKEFRRADGSRVPVLAGTALLPGSDECVGFVLDLTQRKQAEGRAALLAEAGSALSESLDYAETLQSLVHLTVPRLADYGLIFELQEGSRLRLVALRHVDPGQEELLRRLGDVFESAPENPASFLWKAVRAGESALVPRVDDELAGSITSDPDLFDGYRRIAPRSFIIAPLAARGEILGVLLLASADSGRP